MERSSEGEDDGNDDVLSLSLSVLHVSRKLRGTAESSLGAVYGHVMCMKKSRVKEKERLKRIGVSRSF